MELAQVKHQKKAIAGGHLSSIPERPAGARQFNEQTLMASINHTWNSILKNAATLKQLKGLLEANSHSKSSGAMTDKHRQ